MLREFDKELETVIVLLEVILIIYTVYIIYYIYIGYIFRSNIGAVVFIPRLVGQAAVAVKAIGTEGEREARAEEIEIATTRQSRVVVVSIVRIPMLGQC